MRPRSRRDAASRRGAGHTWGRRRLFTIVCREQETLSLIREHRVAVGANYVTLVVNAMCLEGMARQLVPEYNVMDAARPLLVAHAKLPRSIFGAISPAARFAKRMHDRTVLQRLLREGARTAPRSRV